MGAKVAEGWAKAVSGEGLKMAVGAAEVKVAARVASRGRVAS